MGSLQAAIMDNMDHRNLDKVRGDEPLKFCPVLYSGLPQDVLFFQDHVRLGSDSEHHSGD